MIYCDPDRIFFFSVLRGIRIIGVLGGEAPSFGAWNRGGSQPVALFPDSHPLSREIFRSC